MFEKVHDDDAHKHAKCTDTVKRTIHFQEIKTCVWVAVAIGETAKTAAVSNTEIIIIIKKNILLFLSGLCNQSPTVSNS